jgi:hypothetical protein
VNLIPDLRKVAHLDVPEVRPTHFEGYVSTAAAALGITILSVPYTTVPVCRRFQARSIGKRPGGHGWHHPTTSVFTGHIIDECMLRDLPTFTPGRSRCKPVR